MSTTENPYASPREISSIASESLTHRQTVKNQLFLPGLAMLIGGLFGIPFILFRIFVYALPWMRSVESIDSANRTFVLCALMAIGTVVCIYGGVQILRARQFGACASAALVMTFPCTSPVCLMGPLIGIWALVILLRKDTRAAFAEP
jgi:hypothetical protein